MPKENGRCNIIQLSLSRAAQPHEKNKSSISKRSLCNEVGEYWDNHDLSEVWGKTKKVRFDVEIETEATCCAVEKSLLKKVRSIAKKKGISSDTPVNLWIQHKIQERALYMPRPSFLFPRPIRDIDKSALSMY